MVGGFHDVLVDRAEVPGVVEPPRRSVGVAAVPVMVRRVPGIVVGAHEHVVARGPQAGDGLAVDARVVAGAAAATVGPGAAVEVVVPGVAEQSVVATVAGDEVGAGPA